ncbi:MAG: PP2C family protein-serine/threonine phosphatase [Bacteroides sp.]
MEKMMKLVCGCATNVGNSREVNQDTVVLKYIEKKRRYFVVGAVCDGVGGLEHGELASGLIGERIAQWFDEVSSWIDIANTDSKLVYAHLKDAAERWNEELCNFSYSNNIVTGTTMSLFMLLREDYYIIHVGDSRVFCFNSSLLQLTTDASITKIKNGMLKAYLDNYMGKSNELWFQGIEGKAVPGDMFLFCSDGLYHHLTEEDARMAWKAASKQKNLNKLCGELIDAMMERGERDNISLGIVCIRKKGLFG